MPIDWNKEFYSSVLYKTAKTIEHAVKNSVPSSSSPNSNGAYPPGGNTGTPPSYHSAPGAAPYGGNQGVTGSAPHQTPPPTYYQNPPQASSNPSAASKQKKNKKKQPLQPVPGKTMIKKIPSVIPFYVVGAVWLLYAIFFPMYRWFDFVIVTAVSIGFYFLSRLIFKGKQILVPAPQPEPEPEPEKSEMSESDRVVAEGKRYLEELRKADAAIDNLEISNNIFRMEEIGVKIFDFVKENPEKSSQIRKFMNYYLPTTLKLLRTYDKLEEQGIKGDNITSTMVEIERITHTIALAFEKQLDALFQDEALDISTDITVLEGMLGQEGLTGNDFEPESKK